MNSSVAELKLFPEFEYVSKKDVDLAKPNQQLDSWTKNNMDSTVVEQKSLNSNTKKNVGSTVVELKLTSIQEFMKEKWRFGCDQHRKTKPTARFRNDRRYEVSSIQTKIESAAQFKNGKRCGTVAAKHKLYQKFD